MPPLHYSHSCFSEVLVDVDRSPNILYIRAISRGAG